MCHLVLVFSVFTYFCVISARDTSDCYSNDHNPYLFFGTKTAYDLVYERPKQREREIPDCEPVQIWLLARHGTRFPGSNTIRSLKNLENLKAQIARNHEDRKICTYQTTKTFYKTVTGNDTLRRYNLVLYIKKIVFLWEYLTPDAFNLECNGKDKRLCYPDLDRLQSWVLNVTMADANMITSQGKADLYFLAKRIRTKYPSLFNAGYSENLYVFRHTDTERTRQSAYSFAEGLFGTNSGVWIPAPVENDTIIRPYENCSAWKHHVDENPYINRQLELFKIGQEMTLLIKNVSQRLGFLYELPVETVLLMYDMCRYDKAWNVRERSAWCLAFTKEELLVLEYLQDLKSFYEGGYGHEYNLRLGCRPIKDMVTRFTQLEEESEEQGQRPTGVFYFTHSNMLAMTLARLGIASHGVPLVYNNYRDQSKREWRSSYLTPFAGNLAAVFYKCSTGEYNRVMFYLNEKAVQYPGCENGLCSWMYIRERFKDAVTRCDLDWCSTASEMAQLPVLLLLVITYLFTSIP